MVSRQLVLKIFVIILLLTCVKTLSAQEKEAPTSDKVIIILDASGSMWGQIDARPKIDIAKDVVKDLVTDWDESIEIGLTAYGHRRKADCKDIESLVPVGSLQKDSFVASIDALKPVGKTPLTESVRRAAEELKFNEDRATVILVSDGIETCDQDPCKVAAQLEAAGVDFTTHVVGFDISNDSDIAQLKCIAEETGGKYLSAKDAGSLKSSLEAAVQEVAKVETGVGLAAVNEAGGEPLTDVQWMVYQLPADGEQDPKYLRSTSAATPTVKLEPGSYRIKVKSKNGDATGEKDIEVTAEQMQKVEILLAAEGDIELVAVTESGGTPLENMKWVVSTIAKDINEKPKTLKYGRGATPTYRMVPGTYLASVKSVNGEASAEQEIEVIAGKKTRYEVVVAQEGIIELQAVTEAGGTPLKNVTWRIETIPSDELSKPKLVTWGKGATPAYQLLPGRYTAKVKSTAGKASSEQEIEVVAGKRVKQEVIIAQEGIIELKAVHAAGGAALEGITWKLMTVVAEDSMDEPKLVAYGRGNTPSYQLLPGTYLAKAKSVRGQAVAEQQVEVIAGKRTAVEVEFPVEGKIQLVAVEAPGGKPVKVSWALKKSVDDDITQTKKLITYGGGAQPTYQALPGKYLAEAKANGKTVTEEVEVVAGKLSRHELVFNPTQ